MNIKTTNLLDKEILKKHNITQNSEEWKELAKRQRLMRLNVSDETATYLIDKGFHSANHIATMPLKQFLRSCQDFHDSAQLEGTYKVAQTIRSASMHMMVNMKNLHSSGRFSKTKAFSADPEFFTSFEDLPSYEMLFGSLDYYDCSEFSSIFGPAAYLLDLMRITQTYVSDANKDSIPEGLHFFDRRPDIKALLLTEKNTTTEVLKLKIVNERIDLLLQTQIPVAQKDYVAWLDKAVYPFNMPFCLPLTQIHSGLNQAGLSLLAIYETLQVDTEYLFRELLALSPSQSSLVTTISTNLKKQAELWGLVEGAEPFAGIEKCANFSKQTGFDAKNLVDLFEQNLNIDTEIKNAANFYISKHLVKHKSATAHYFDIKGKYTIDALIENLNIADDSTAVVDSLDMIGRFIRFSQYTGLSFQEADWLLNTAEFLITGIAPYDSGTQEKRIDALSDDKFKTVGKIYQLAGLLQQPVTDILNSLGIIKTYGVGMGTVSEAPFDVVFNSAINDNPYHPTYAGNPDFYKDTVQTWDLSNKNIPLPIANILSQLGLRKVELLTLGKYVLKILNISTQQLPLSVENLSLLYSYSSISIWLNINITEFVLIDSNLNNKGDSIDHLILLTDTVLWMQKHNTDIFKVDYIINGNISRYVDLGFSAKDFPQWFKSIKALIPLAQGKVTDEIITKLIDAIANFLNAPQEMMKALFAMNSTDWVLDFLTPSSSAETQLSIIIKFSRLLTLNKLLKTNAPTLLSSINQYPESYGFKQFPADKTKVGINLTQLQNLTDFRNVQIQFNDAKDDLIHYVEEKAAPALVPKFDKGVGYTVTNTNTITNTSKKQGWSNSIIFSSDIIKDGGVCLKMGQVDKQTMFGLAASLTDMYFGTIDYAIFANQGELFVVEKGVNNKPAFGEYTVNDTLLVERVGDTINYLKNDTIFYTSTIKTGVDLHLCITFADDGDFVTDVLQSDFNHSKANEILHHLTNWDIEQIQTISTRYPQYNGETAAFIALVNRIFSLTDNLGNDVNMLFTLSDETTVSMPGPDTVHSSMQAASELLFTQLKSCYTPENFQIISQVISGGVLEKKRDITVEIATWALRKTYGDIASSRNLSEFLLTDVNVSAKIKTSYIKEAINAAQLYLQRVKLDIEQHIVSLEIEDIWWQWISNYRIWEANREIYLYPENYLEPSLRKNQSKSFQDFSQILLKSNITSESAEEAFEKYFQDFEELVGLNYLSSYYTEIDNQAIYYHFAVSRTHPPQYYYCTYSYDLNSTFDFQNEGTWSLWNSVAITINSKNITPFYYKGKFMLFWAEIKKSNTSNVSSTASENGTTGGVATNSLDVYKATVKYSILEESGSWKAAQTLISEEVVYVDDKQNISKNKLETGSDTYALFSGLFEDMNSDEWNTVYINAVDDNIALYYGPFVNEVASDAIKIPASLSVESISILESFQMHLFDLIEKRLNAISGDSRMPYIGIKVFNQYLEQIDVEVGRCTSSDPLLSVFLSNDDKRFVIDNNAYNESLYVNLVGNMYSNSQFGNIAQTEKLVALGFYELTGSLKSMTVDIATFISGATTAGYIEKAGASYYATTKYSLLLASEQRDQISKIVGKTVTDAVFNDANQLLMTGKDNKALMLFSDINTKHSKQFAVKNKSGAFLHENKTSSLFLNLQEKQAKESDIISPRLFYSTPLLSRDCFVMTGVDKNLSREIFSSLLKDGYILPLSTINGSGGFQKAFQTLVNSLFQGFADTDKFTHDMSADNWGKLANYFASTEVIKITDLSIVQKIFNIILAAPFVSSDFFIESLLDKKDMTDKIVASESVYKALQVQAKVPQTLSVIDGNSRLCYPIIADQGYQIFKKIVTNGAKDTTFSEREFEGMFNQIINCNSTIEILNTGYKSALTDTHFNLTDCQDIEYNIMRMGTVAFARLQKQLKASGMSEVLSLKNQQIPITEGEVITDLMPPKGAKLPSLLKNDQIDFIQGPYAQYYWEVFFHAPILIAKNLSNQNKFEEAIDYLRYIFNPSKKREYLTPTTFSTEAPKKIDVATSGKALTTLQNTKLDADPYVDNKGSVNKNYKGDEDLSFLKLNIIQTQFIRDILSNYHLVNPVNHYWNFQPFCNHTLQTLEQLLTNPASIRQYENDPFDPFAIARLRIGAFEKYVLMLYIDILIQWGDNLFTVDTRESINEATMLYLYAYDLLGEKPEDLGKKQAQNPASFADILKKYKDSSAIPEFLVDMENKFHFKDLPIVKTVNQPFNDIPSYFCIPENSQLIARWNTVEDRLNKIHNSLDIEGNFQELALFAPPINPLDLIRAAASGGNVLNANSQGNKAVPIYRFASIVQLTRQCIENVVSLGRLLEGNLEKYEAEDLSLLHTTQEGVMLNLISNLKQDSIEQEQDILNGLSSNLQSAQDRKKYYDGLISGGMSHYENEAQKLEDSAIAFNIAAAVASAIASIAYGVPQAGSPFALTYGGVQLGGTVSAIATGFNAVASVVSFGAQRLLTNGSYDRRNQEWVFSSGQADDQMKEINHQILASKVRIKMAEQELSNHAVQTQQNQDISDYLHNKFTSEELYQWLAGRVSALYHQQYQLALETAALAQKAYQFELNSKQEFINIIYWDTAHRGLLAGESLLSSLTTMEQSYKTHLTDRKLEMEKTISLSQFNAEELANFKKSGECGFVFTEKLFDNDFPGHYQRQIKSVSISIPAIVGPYQNLHATLTQVHNDVVLSPSADAVKYLLGQGGNDQDVRHDWRSNQKIAITKGVEDSGVFQLDFRDELYLPFENTGVISTWKLSMPKTNNQGIDYNSISDVIINLRYTAIDGGATFSDTVNQALKQSATYPTSLYHDLSRSFPIDWRTFMQDRSNPKQQQLKFNFNTRELQYHNVVNLDKVVVRIITSEDIQIGASKEEMLSLSVGDKEAVKVNMTGEISKGDAQSVVVKDWCETKGESSGSKIEGIGWVTELNLEKNSTINTIDSNWVLSFSLDAIAKDDNFKKILKDGFIDPDKLLKIELLSLCCVQLTK